MAYLGLFWYDYIIFLIVIGSSLAIGIYYGCFVTYDNVHTKIEINSIAAAVSLIASAFSVVDLLTIPAEIYMHGTQFWIHALSMPIVGLIVNYVYLPVFWELKLNSSFEYLELRFDKNVKRLAVFVILTGVLCFTPLLIYATALTVSQVSGIGVNYVAIAISIICICYTTIGGFKAVVWADNLQFAVTLCSISVALVMGILPIGGFENIWKRAEDGDRIEFFRLNPDPTIRSTFWTVLIGNALHWVVFTVIHPAGVQRLLSVSTIKNSRSVLIVFVLGMMVSKSIMCFSGLIIYSRYFDCDPVSLGQVQEADQIVPYYVLDVASEIPGLGTLFIAGLISMGLSVLSTNLNVISHSLYANVLASFTTFKTTKEKEKNTIRIIAALTGIVTFCMIFVIEKLGSLLELISMFTGAGGALLGVYTLGVLCPFANAKGTFYGGITAILLTSWIIIKKEINVWNGVIKYESKPLFTSGCNITFLNETTTANPLSVLNNTTSTTVTELEEPWWLFKISFHYYIVVGWLISTTIGLIISLTTRKSHVSVDSILLSPVVKRFLHKSVNNTRYHSVEILPRTEGE